MGNGRKQTALWLVFVEGAALSLGIYLLLTVLLSALAVVAVALLCWQQITWLGRGGVLLLCGAGGGLLAGLLGGRRRKRKRRPVRRGRKA